MDVREKLIQQAVAALTGREESAQATPAASPIDAHRARMAGMLRGESHADLEALKAEGLTPDIPAEW